jgi:hypothetical protein
MLMGIELQDRRMPNDARNDTSGRFVSKYPKEAFLDALRGANETGTREIAREVGCDYDTARLRLYNLAEQGTIQKRQVSSVTLWSLQEADE